MSFLWCIMSYYILGLTLLVHVTRNPSVFLMVHHAILYSGPYALSPDNQESSYYVLGRTL